MGVKLLISEIKKKGCGRSASSRTLSRPPTNKCYAYLFLLHPAYILNIMVSTTQTLAQIKSHEYIGHQNETQDGTIMTFRIHTGGSFFDLFLSVRTKGMLINPMG